VKKGLLIGCGVATVLLAVCGGAVGLFVYALITLTGEPVTAADRMLALVGVEKITEAYQSTAAAYQADHTEPQFFEQMKKSGLTGYQSSFWHNRQIKNNQATLEGTVTLRNGTTIPVTVELVKEGDAWKVLSVQVQQGGVIVEPMPNGGAEDRPNP
jgi:hypothetical protein